MSCIGFSSQKQRAQLASPEVIAARLPFSTPALFGARQRKRLLAQSVDPDPRVRAIAGSHPVTPHLTLMALASDVDIRVRTAVAGNHATGKRTLELLANDEVPRIAWFAQMRLDNDW